MGALAALAHGSLKGDLGEDFLRTVMYSLGKGGELTTADTEVSFQMRAIRGPAPVLCL